jgi:hypothetical protein
MSIATAYAGPVALSSYRSMLRAAKEGRNDEAYCRAVVLDREYFLPPKWRDWVLHVKTHYVPTSISV